MSDACDELLGQVTSTVNKLAIDTIKAYKSAAVSLWEEVTLAQYTGVFDLHVGICATTQLPLSKFDGLEVTAFIKFLEDNIAHYNCLLGSLSATTNDQAARELCLLNLLDCSHRDKEIARRFAKIRWQSAMDPIAARHREGKRLSTSRRAGDCTLPGSQRMKNLIEAICEALFLRYAKPDVAQFCVRKVIQILEELSTDEPELSVEVKSASECADRLQLTITEVERKAGLTRDWVIHYAYEKSGTVSKSAAMTGRGISRIVEQWRKRPPKKIKSD